ncbi:hypothetical protein [Mesorhizobium sp.]|uniref:hypothetical protein n=1 Tax=Mesorhizobium sp. TaxID=1871066 RepID=UPI0025FE2E54|nr:hypothetical protein [Mesorhizobium sp.]
MTLSFPADLLAQPVVRRKVLAPFLCLVQEMPSFEVISWQGCAIDSGRALTT